MVAEASARFAEHVRNSALPTLLAAGDRDGVRRKLLEKLGHRASPEDVEASAMEDGGVEDSSEAYATAATDGTLDLGTSQRAHNGTLLAADESAVSARFLEDGGVWSAALSSSSSSSRQQLVRQQQQQQTQEQQAPQQQQQRHQHPQAQQHQRQQL